MARGKTLNQLVEQLRAETGYNTNTATGVGALPALQQAIRAAQEEIYDEYAWPFLNARRNKTLSAGQRYYDFPSDLPAQNISAVDTRWSNQWIPVTFGIGMEHYSIHDSDDDARVDPVQRWSIIDTGSGEQIEVWPIPATSGTLRLHGRRALGALTANSDEADLDDILIVQRAATKILTLRGDELAAREKAAAYQRRFAALRARFMLPNEDPVVPGGALYPRRRPIEIRVARTSS